MDIFTDLKVAVCGIAQFYKYGKQFHLETFYNSRTRVTNVTTLNYHKPSIDAFRFSVIVMFATSVGGLENLTDLTKHNYSTHCSFHTVKKLHTLWFPFSS